MDLNRWAIWQTTPNYGTTELPSEVLFSWPDNALSPPAAAAKATAGISSMCSPSGRVCAGVPVILVNQAGPAVSRRQHPRSGV
jgi:hypothetical protein